MFLATLFFIALVKAQVTCPLDGSSPSVTCDTSANCFHHCCISTGLCPSSSCVSSFDDKNNARANCANKCLTEVACVRIVKDCVGPHCFGTVKCLTTSCDGRREGDVCLYDGVSRNFKVCDSHFGSEPTPVPSNPPPVAIPVAIPIAIPIAIPVTIPVAVPVTPNCYYTITVQLSYPLGDLLNRVQGQLPSDLSVTAVACGDNCLKLSSTVRTPAELQSIAESTLAFVRAQEGVTSALMTYYCTPSTGVSNSNTEVTVTETSPDGQGTGTTTTTTTTVDGDGGDDNVPGWAVALLVIGSLCLVAFVSLTVAVLVTRTDALNAEKV